MDFETLVQTRRSVRGFKKQPVPRTVIEEVIEVAKRAPSSMNTQPWHIHGKAKALQDVCKLPDAGSHCLPRKLVRGR